MTRPRRFDLLSNSPADAPAWRWSASAFDAAVWADAPHGTATAVDRAGRVTHVWQDPLAALDHMAATAWRPAPTDARWVGYLGYDLGRVFEDLPATAADDLGLPAFAFALAADDASVPVAADPSNSPSPPAGTPAARGGPIAGAGSTFSREAYLRAVARAIEYVRAGDVFQVNLSQRLTLPCPGPADAVYRRLRAAGGARYGALLDFDTFALVSGSPELFLRVVPQPDGRRRIVNRPIKGTRPRLPGMDRELLASAKDQAELAMIVDLQRNDLGRICEIGSVKVTQPRAVEAHPTVFQGVATIEGVLRPGVGLVDILRATFPCGSVTGCPKIRAMQVIDELEPVRRGPYCGAIGWVGPGGALEFSVAIRTMVVTGGTAYLPVGGGIVADSDPAAEYEETLVKARAMLATLGLSPDDVRGLR